jgi:glycolate oxidase iron-sulfur subunit
MLLVDEGRLELGESYVTHIDRCLACRACETACPSGVKYGVLVERARAQIEQGYRRGALARILRNHVYGVLGDFRALTRHARLLRAYQCSGLQKLVRATGFLKLLGLAEVEALSPEIERDFFFREIGSTYPAVGERRARVAFLAGCIASVAFAELNRATIRVLQQNGIEVWVAAGQSCCGALHAHAGLRDKARNLARQNIEAMLSDDVDAIVTNAAGCGSTLKEYDDLLASDPQYASRAKQFAQKVRDVNELLAQLGLRAPARKITGRVTYQDPCHLAHGQRIREAPRQLLRAIATEFVEMRNADQCCGSAGVYNVVQNALATQILDGKMNDVVAAKPQIIATANVGCMLQLRAGVRQRGLAIEVRHVMELLDQAYGGPASS